jgi:hypothetical protein
VTETTRAGRSVATGSPKNWWWAGRGGWLLLLLVGVLLIVIGAAGGYIFGRQLTYNDVLAARQLTDQLQSENQTLNRQITSQSANITSLETKLTTAQAELNAITPSTDTYNIEPNQALVVGDGRLTIGLVGSPSNRGVELNVNGKQQLMAAGDFVQITPEPASNCQVRVQSFDMFKAVVTAYCAVKAQ